MPEKLCVAMLGSYPMDTTRIWGGVQAAYSYLVKGLFQEENLEIHILTIKSSQYAGPEQVHHGNTTLHLLCPYPRFERLRNYHTYQAIINQELMQIRPDLIHAQDAGAEALVAIRSSFPVVITVHGIRWEDGKYYHSINKLVRNYFDSRFTERYVIRHARHLIAISQYVTDYFNALIRPDIDLYYIPNAIDERFFNLPEYPDKQVILFAGRVIPRKRVMELVRAFDKVHHQFPSAHLHIAGETSTEPAYVESIRRWVHQSHLHEHVHFLGQLTEESILTEFAGCSLLALPSAQETAPMVIAQAMACEKPVVATRVGGVAEMVGEDCSRGFLVNVGDIDGLAAALIHFLQNPDLRVRMGLNAGLFARDKYHPDRVARHTTEVYRRIAFEEQKVTA
jgi:glycosyltransferase involved in cell wall biosynthesis